MPQITFRTDSAGRSDVGLVRRLNEDSYLIRPDIGLWAVADGMGGHDAGDFASGTLVAELDRLTAAESGAALLAAAGERVLAANGRMRAAAAGRGSSAVIGCTLALLIIHGDAYACVWSGDSRVYRVRAGRIEQISRDHTEVQELMDRGVLTPEEARTWPRRNVITRAVGVFDVPELAVERGQVAQGDVFILCSDGLTGHVGDDEILRATANRPARGICDELVGLTLERGASDNVTVVAVSCGTAAG